MTTPPAPVMYSSISDLKLVLDSTDAGTGTAAQLSDEQLTLALTAATDRVTMYAGLYYDDPATTPTMITSITLDLAAWWATTYYLKAKDMGPNHPVVLRYTEATKVLEAIRKGEVDVNVPAASASGGGSGGESGGKVINRIPAVFTGYDSNTRVLDGVLTADTPPSVRGGPRPGVKPYSGADGW